MKKYEITITETQLKLIKRGLEAISRAGTKQYDYALEQLEPEMLTAVGGMKKMWLIKDIIRALSNCKLSTHESLGIGNASDDARISYDMYQVIESLDNKDRSVLPYSEEELMTIKEVK